MNQIKNLMAEQIYSIDYVGHNCHQCAAVTEFVVLQALTTVCAMIIHQQSLGRYANLLHYQEFNAALMGELPSFVAGCNALAKNLPAPLNLTVLLDVIRHDVAHPVTAYCWRHESALREINATQA